MKENLKKILTYFFFFLLSFLKHINLLSKLFYFTSLYVRRSGRIRRKSHDLVLRYRHLKMGIDYTNTNFFLFSNQRLSISTTFPIEKVAENSIVH